jgi:O-acetyl-ADP-ribose deacetylase (regulator of RNase III)
MPLSIVRHDITTMKVNAIVNAANTRLQMGGGVCGAIFKAAGADKLQAACDKLSPIKTGDAVVTPGFRLPARFIIHTAGPVYQDGQSGEEELLRACYRNSLRLALINNCKSIAFPLISSGIYGYPKSEALGVATAEILAFLNKHDMEIYQVVFDKEAFAASQKLLSDVKSYVDAHYVDLQLHFPRRQLLEVEAQALEEADFPRHYAPAAKARDEAAPSYGLEDLVGRLDEPFSQTLLRLIDAKGMDDVSVYKRANLSRKLFSKIRIGKGYTPSKRTAIALAIALELTLDETQDLLQRAGYALSRSQKLDVIVEYFILERDYNIFRINEVLFEYDQPLLGG